MAESDLLRQADDYSKEPPRSKALRVNAYQPFNAEPESDDLADSEFITPQDIFLVRNHGPVPLINPKDFFLEVKGYVNTPLKLSLDDIKKYKKVTVCAVIQCAGNRRNEFSRYVKQVVGVGWEHCALSNTYWSGALLSDVLKDANIMSDSQINPNEKDKKVNLHVWFDGLDLCKEKTAIDKTPFLYGSSIPLHKAIDVGGDVLLAYEMNGEPLPRDHGFPLRAVVPGYIGARSVKWLNSITIETKESPKFHQQRDYKLFNPQVNWDNVEPLWEKAASIGELNVQSAILRPLQGEEVKGPTTIQGYAFSSGKKIIRVDISLDGGSTWETAQLYQEDKGDEPKYWSWTLWKYEANNLPSPCEIVCRAWDSAGNTQPDKARDIWNLRGVMNNSWHRVLVNGYIWSRRGTPMVGQRFQTML